MRNSKECALTDSELTDKVEKWVTDLCHSKGKKRCLRFPADHNHDPGFLLTEVVRRMNRYASRISELEAERNNPEQGKHNLLKEKSMMYVYRPYGSKKWIRCTYQQFLYYKKGEGRAYAFAFAMPKRSFSC